MKSIVLVSIIIIQLLSVASASDSKGQEFVESISDMVGGDYERLEHPVLEFQP